MPQNLGQIRFEMAVRNYSFTVVALVLVATISFVGGLSEKKDKPLIPLPKEQLRIVGGFRSEEIIPYQVSIQSRAVENIVNRLVTTFLPFVKAEWTHVCGGAIISEKHVLTAAHCIVGSDPYDLTIVAGTADLAYRAYRHSVKNFVVHPNYREYLSSDIAVITIRDTFKYGPTVQKIKYDDDHDVPVGTACKFFGWGYVTPVKFGINAFQLKGIELKVISNDDCQSREYAVGDTEMCTFRGFVQGLCAGDSGGALTTWDQNRIIGIASYSSQLCGTGLPDMFTRVSKFVKWIKDEVDGRDSYNDSHRT